MAKIDGNELCRLGHEACMAKEYDKAIELLTKALEDPKLKKPGRTWNRLGTAYYGKGDLDRAIECYQKAISTPGYDTPGWAWNNMGLAHYNKGEYDRAIECYQKALDTPGYDEPGKAWNNMGVAYKNKGEYDRAIECYQKALDTPGFDEPEKAWNNMSIAHTNKGEYDRAIECYQKALDTPGDDTPGKVWHSMGWTYELKGEYDRAIECYQKAMDTPGLDKPGDTRNNIGSTYIQTREYDKAIDSLLKALAEPRTPNGFVEHNLGNAYFEKEDYQEAKKYWKQAVAIYERSDPSSAKLLQRRIKQAQAKIDDQPLSRSEQTEAAMAEGVLKTATRQEEKGNAAQAKLKDQLVEEVGIIVRAHSTAALEYCRPVGRNRKAPWRRERGPLPGIEVILPKNYFLNLKAWSSNLPLMAGYLQDRFGGRPIQGGGYYIRWKNKGIVIDPGIGFIENLHSYNLHLTDINLVLVTHCHIDHNGDLNRLVDLLREYNAIAKKPHEIEFFLDIDTYNSSKNLEIEGTRGKFIDLLKVGGNYRNWKQKYGFIPVPFPTYHGDYLKYSLGIVLEFYENSHGEPPFRLGLSSDTALTDDVKIYLKKCDAIVAHFSKTNEEDLARVKKLHHHLGYMGISELFNTTEAQLCVAAEWSGDRGDLRYQFTELLRLECPHKEKTIIPSDIGLVFSIPDMKIRCRACQRMVDRKDIIVGRPDVPFGRIMYYCEDCLGKGQRA